MSNLTQSPLIDAFGRSLSYVRLSVTDRCDLRCTYCMSEQQTFLPRRDILSFDEMERLSLFLIEAGVERIRITGGEPLVRKGILDFLRRLGVYVHSGLLKELTLTTNGTLLEPAVPALVESGVARINVSCDSLNAETYKRITRGGDLSQVMKGIDAAQKSGLRIKLNVVALAQDNHHEIPDILRFAHQRGFDVSLIETMPMGDEIGGREAQFLSLKDVLSELMSFWTLTPSSEKTGGPARYYHIAETSGTLGLITPLSHNFCDTCNRVRITCSGKLYMCLGQDDHVDLAAALREDPTSARLHEALKIALMRKPKAHDFFIAGADPVGKEPLRRHRPARTMSLTGG